jgi:methionyl-tRNA synthetase
MCEAIVIYYGLMINLGAKQEGITPEQYAKRHEKEIARWWKRMSVNKNTPGREGR